VTNESHHPGGNRRLGQVRSIGRSGSAIANELIAFGENAAFKTDLLEYANHYACQSG
jgi:hypothetical protein